MIRINATVGRFSSPCLLPAGHHRCEEVTDPAFIDVADFPTLNYSKKAVARAGEVIVGGMVWNDETEPDIRQAFQIANSWRDSHAFPMKSVRASITAYLKANDFQAITAARLKRMQAIRGKLRRLKGGLSQIQDLGGCRVIMDTMADVKELVSIVRLKTQHKIAKENDYISNPKPDGYRSFHIVFSFVGKVGAKQDTTIYNGRKIELQIRTKLQHSWATAVEAIGLFRGEALKNHEGDERWLRFFSLISMEFAQVEKGPLPEGAPSAAERRTEIVSLAEELDAISVLDRVSHGILGTDLPLAPGYRPTHYLIKYDRITKTVSVEPHSKPIDAMASYDRAEMSDNQTGQDNFNVVLVEVDKIKNLKKAYPNYFGDVDLFRSNLRLILEGKEAKEYTRVLRRSRKVTVEDIGDMAWLRRSPFPRPDVIPSQKVGKRKIVPGGD